MDKPVMMTKEYWTASQLSVARFSGGCKVWGHEYLVMPQTFDLLRTDFIPFYKKLGRDRFMQMLKDNPLIGDADLKRMMQETVKADKVKKTSDTPKQGELF